MTSSTLRALSLEPVGSLDVDLSWRERLAWAAPVVAELQHWTRRMGERVVGKRNVVHGLSLPFGLNAQVLIIVPPFASLWYPSLAAHLLQACGHRAGFSVDVLYASILLASWIGEHRYEQIGAESVTLIPERFFARSAFGLPPLGRGAEHMYDSRRVFGEQRGALYEGLYPDGKATTLGGVAWSITPKKMYRLEKTAPAWIDLVARKIVSGGYRIVGCTTTFQQTAASIAILKRVKQLAPKIITILGGANCEGDMAEGLAGLDTGVDHFFSGESEETFTSFVRSTLQGSVPRTTVMHGTPCKDMNALPPISCSEFFNQRSSFLPHSAPAQVSYLSFETSRGCWWGQKHHCTFCGLNGEGMGFRSKSPDRVMSELKSLLAESPTRNISMTDNIMPREYFRTLLPRLENELPGLRIFYEQKSNLSFEEMQALKAAGIDAIQPGIEALSSRLLKLMRKGVSASRNLMLLRYGRITGVRLNWNLLCGFPNDDIETYRETSELVPLIVHLQPPSGLWHLSIDRFSPYFFEPEAHNVTNVRCLPVYRDVFPEGADTAKIAYHFLADYPSDTHRHIDLVRNLNARIRTWVRAWERGYRRRPELKLCNYQDHYVLFDTRGLPGTQIVRHIDTQEAELLMNAKPYRHTKQEDQAIAGHLAVAVDNWFVPLVVAREALFRELSKEDKIRRHAVAA